MKSHFFISTTIAAVFSASAADLTSREILDKLKVDPAFTLSVVAEGVEDARSMVEAEDGSLYVGSRGEGKVYRLADRNGDGTYEEKTVLLSSLRSPSGLALRDGDLFVSAISKLYRLVDVMKWNPDKEKPQVIYDKLPSDGHHGWKVIAFGPDGLLYVPVGAPCNICLKEKDPRYAALLKFKVPPKVELGAKDFKTLEEPTVFASGIRNTLGFTWHPKTKELWFTDNGRDHLGDDEPPCEVNISPKEGMHFGFPFCHGSKKNDPEFGKKRTCSDPAFTPPVVELKAHVAPLGIIFWKGKVLIAEHGSWNRTHPSGYKIQEIVLNKTGDRPTGATRPLIEGWLQGDKPEDGPAALGRPVAFLNRKADGALLITDDHRGRIYALKELEKKPLPIKK